MMHPQPMPEDIEAPEVDMSQLEFRNGMKGVFWGLVFSAPIWTVLICWLVTR